MKTPFPRFCVVGLSGVAVETAALYALSTGASVPIPLAKVLAVEVAILSNFTLNNVWTFHHANAPLASSSTLALRCGRFHLACATGAAVNIVLFSFLKSGGVNFYIAHFAGVACAAGLNYFLCRRFVWFSKQSA